MSKRKKIRIWMLENGIRAVDAARELGITRSSVSHWMSGRGVSSRIKNWFEMRGCPKELLAREE